MLLVGAGCRTAPNFLDGSLVDVYNLQFDETRIRLYDSELSIEYVDNLTATGMVALRLTAQNTPKLKSKERYDLIKTGNIGRGEGYESPFPELDSGHIRLDRFGRKADDKITGNFRAIFITPEDDKLTVSGGFTAELEIVEHL